MAFLSYAKSCLNKFDLKNSAVHFDSVQGAKQHFGYGKGNSFVLAQIYVLDISFRDIAAVHNKQLPFG